MVVPFASLGKPLSHLLGQTGIGLASSLFNGLTHSFPILGRPFIRFNDKIQVVDICYNGH